MDHIGSMDILGGENITEDMLCLCEVDGEHIALIPLQGHRFLFV